MNTRATELRRSNEDRCRRILEEVRPLRSDDLAWDQVGKTRLDPGLIETLVYMRDVEGFTDRDLVGLTAHRTTLGDPLIAKFLQIWRAEEASHAEALGVFLDRYSSAHGIEVPRRQLPPPAVAPWREGVTARVGGVVGDVVAAAHMAWGAANELLTLNGYRMLARDCDHPVLTELLGRIARQESRHFSFYILHAEWRLAASRSARAILPRVLRGSWSPVGVGDGYKRPDEFAAVLARLAPGGTGDSVIARMDRRFSSLPGFGELRIFARAASDAAALHPHLHRLSVAPAW